MSPRLEEIIVFALAAILVALFAWIYARDPQKTTRLWMLGWIAVLIHFAAPAFDLFSPALIRFTWWLKGATLIIAGTFFLLSVSGVFSRHSRRLTFIFFITVAAILYLTGMEMRYSSSWFYISLLVISSIYGIAQAIQFYGWKSPYLYSLFLMLPYAG